jgi:cytochrome c556
MRFTQVRHLLAVVAATTLLSPAAMSHFDDKEVPQSYRQSWFTLLAMNFGPMGAMAKGEIPWDESQVQGYAADLEAVTKLDLMRGFPDGSDKGTTRAKPEIWKNKADFEAKLGDLRTAAAELNAAAASGDRKQITDKVGATGKACKACHDEYKAKNYLY